MNWRLSEMQVEEWEKKWVKGWKGEKENIALKSKTLTQIL